MFSKLVRINTVASVLALLALSMASQKSLAEQRSFKLINITDSTINGLYISPANSNDWGQNILNSGIPSNRYITINYDDSVCIYDIRTTRTNNQQTRSRRNLCETRSHTITDGPGDGESLDQFDRESLNQLSRELNKMWQYDNRRMWCTVC
jgi:hypothetical protein